MISAKGKRTLILGEKEYLWRVKHRKRLPWLEVINPETRKAVFIGPLAKPGTEAWSSDINEIISFGAQEVGDEKQTTLVIQPSVVRAVIESREL